MPTPAFAAALQQEQPDTPSITPQTIISTNITTTTTWTKSASPYQVTQDIAVAAGVTLTVQPGVQVIFNGNTRLEVLGAIRAVGTQAEPILFTGANKSAGSWEGILFYGNATTTVSGVFDYTTVEYGGSGTQGGNLYLRYAQVKIDHSTIGQGGANGIFGSTMSDADVANTNFVGNASKALWLTNPVHDPILTNLSASNNGQNVVAFGALSQEPTIRFEKMGLPYLITADLYANAQQQIIVEAGVELQFDPNTRLDVRGTITALGTANAPILFTGVDKTPGSWEGILFYGNANAPITAFFDHVTIEYGGSGTQGGNLYLSYTYASLNHATIRNGGAHGIFGAVASTVAISDSIFTGNQNYVLWLTDATRAPKLVHLSASGNGKNAVGIGSLNNEPQWRFAQMGLPYIVTADLYSPSNQEVTIEAGVEVRFDPNTRLDVRGKLLAQGTQTAPITLTGSTKTPGSWEGLLFYGNAISPTLALFDYVTLEYGGVGSQGGNLYLSYGQAEISHSFIRNGGSNGIFSAVHSDVDLTDSTITGNAGYALSISDPTRDLNFTNVVVTGNGKEGVAVSSISAPYTWSFDAIGVPYLITADLYSPAGQKLSVEAGVELRFAQNTRLDVRGELMAMGTTSKPITFTGSVTTAGSWEGLLFYGTYAVPAVGTFDHVLIEYGGVGTTGANLYLSQAQASIANSIIRNGGAHGVYVNNVSAGVTIERSQIVNNAAYGVYNAASHRTVLAANNWWGNASGPTSDNSCNPGGTGSRISAGVAFRPVLAAANADPGLIAPVDLRQIAVVPQRWFAPADGVTIVYVALTLLDGNGRPLPGVKLRLQSTLGSVTDGGVTDVTGKTFAQVRSSQIGDARLTASTDVEQDCNFARSATTSITFNAPNGDDALLTDAAAPYLDNGIEIVPEPITRGVPTILRARLKNPNNFPMVVDASFGYAQSGIGLAFGPVGEVLNQTIPANGSKVIEVQWVPTLSGHYCVKLTYTVHGLNSAAVNAGGSSQRNLNVAPGPFLTPPQKNSIQKAKLAGDAIDDGEFLISAIEGPSGIPTTLIQDQLFGNIIDFINEAGGAIDCAMGGGESCGGWSGPHLKLPGDTIGNLKNDPPSQDYDLLVSLETLTFTPVQAGAGMPAARAAALNALVSAQLDLATKLVATVVSYDRYAGATEANRTQWSALQAGAYLFYLHKSANAMIEVADRWDALVAELQSEGISAVNVSAADFATYQQRLKTQGFTALELQAARQVGLTDAGIELIRQRRIALDPTQVAGNILDDWSALASAYREAGNNILAPPAFGVSIGGGPGLQAADVAEVPDHSLVRLFDQTTTIAVGNPTDQVATIDLQVRPVDLPADWTATVTPITTTLAPGQQTTVTVTIHPGSAVAQGTAPRVAVEGYVEGKLLSGVVFEVQAPRYIFFDGQLRTYLPLVSR
ncbi:MAG: right-handed parallel beta-helix repeat-containing protein [Caldilineaceae bacterium]